MCPKCKKELNCGCESCRKRKKEPDPSAWIPIEGTDNIQCPHCKEVLNGWNWADWNLDREWDILKKEGKLAELGL